MNFKNQFLPLTIVGLLIFSFTSCSDDDDSSTPDDGEEEVVVVIPEVETTIAGFVAANPDNYSSLLAALTATDLVDAVSDENANLTVFAPDNDAFDVFLTAAGFENGLSDVDTDEEIALVRNILLNHVIGTELKAADVVAATAEVPFYGSTLATGPNNLAGTATSLSIFINSDLEINGQATIVAADVYDATNGVIHAVDTVIGLPNITTFAIADTRLSTLVAALSAAELVDDIMDLETATVFAPSNDAFTDGGYELSDATTDLLTYHVINEVNVDATDAEGLAGTDSPETLQGQSIGILTGPTFIGNGNTEDDIATVVIPNIQATNGIIHVIDTVLLPGAEL